MLGIGPTKKDQQLIKPLIQAYETFEPQIRLFHDQLLAALKNSAALNMVIHSIRSRIKDRNHLADKLARKIHDCEEKRKAFEITPDNLLVEVNDLIGIRLLHLYTRQITAVDAALRDVFKEGKYGLLEGPFARTWDDESRQFFKGCNIKTQNSSSMYTSVHYIIGSASRTTVTAEIQVRTLMEEVWGEVDHAMNYPHPVDSIPCQEQLKVLARVTSSASRLVDSIFATVNDHKIKSKRGTAAVPRTRRI